jgi:hypothetical protein
MEIHSAALWIWSWIRSIMIRMLYNPFAKKSTPCPCSNSLQCVSAFLVYEINELCNGTIKAYINTIEVLIYTLTQLACSSALSWACHKFEKWHSNAVATNLPKIDPKSQKSAVCTQQLVERRNKKGCVTYIIMFRGLLCNYCVSIPFLKLMMLNISGP